MVIPILAKPVISGMSQRDFHDGQAGETRVRMATTKTASSQVQDLAEGSSSSLPIMASSGPTNRQQQIRNNESREDENENENEDEEEYDDRKEGEVDQQVSITKSNNINLNSDSDNFNQGFTSPLSASFSFNSYQDILCSASGPGCTFSASDVKRTLSNNCNAINRNTSQTFKPLVSVGVALRSGLAGSQRQHGQQSFNSKPANFRLHSRQKSIGKLNELLNPQQTSVVNLVPIEQRSNKQHQRQQPAAAYYSTQLTSIDSKEFSEATNKLQSIQEPVTTSITSKFATQEKCGEENYDSRSEMSQTIQSIQSLSMQLNQAANLRGSSLSELSQMSSIGAQSANNVGLDQQQQQQANFMAVSSGKITRLVGKKASRVKELVLQNLGKADKTTDELFQMYEENFYKQQNHAMKLQKEFKTYINSLKGIHITSKNLNSCIQESTGDYQSARHDLVCENLSQFEHLNCDLMDKLRSQVLVSVNEYTSQFTKLREKIAKRKRKLIDYDSSKRVYELMLASINKRRAQIQRGLQEQEQQKQKQQHQQHQQQQVSSRSLSRFIPGSSQNNQANDSIQSATNQLVDEARLLKLREQYNYCKIMYETINNELYEELPMIYEKKMKHLLMTLQNYFSIEAQFHSNAGKLYATASDVIDELPMSIHAAHKRNNGNHHHQSSNIMNHSSSPGSHTNVNVDGEEYNNKVVQITSGSSGVGSSRGDSSLESSSSPEAASSSGNSSPSHQQVCRAGGEVKNGDDDENDDYEDVEDENEDQEETDDDDDSAQIGDVAATDSEVIDGAKQLEMSPSTSRDNNVTTSGNGKMNQKQEMASSSTASSGAGESLNCRVEQRGNLQSCLDQLSNRQQVISRDLKEELKAVVKGKEALKNKIALEDAREEQEDEESNGDKVLELEKQIDPSSKGIELNKDKADKSEIRCLYKVKTIYKYLAEDVDELCFEADELIQVIEFDETEEQEEGWLKGIREVNGQIGLFPANFTQPI